jgi:hypothetical protein
MFDPFMQLRHVVRLVFAASGERQLQLLDEYVTLPKAFARSLLDDVASRIAR